MNQKITIVFVIVFVVTSIASVGAIGYFAFVQKPAPTTPSESATTQSLPPTPGEPERKVLRASLGTSPIPENQKPPLTLYDPLVEAWFEGWDRLYYEFAYPEDEVFVHVSDDNRKIILAQETGAAHTIMISYEGGRGFTPRTYWEEKNPCPDCRQIVNPIEIQDAQNLTTFASDKKEYIIFQGPEPSGAVWLFVAQLQQPADTAELVLSTFTFIQPQLSEYHNKTALPPQPSVIRAYMSQYDNPDKVAIVWTYEGAEKTPRAAHTVRGYWAPDSSGPWLKLDDIRASPATIYFKPPQTKADAVYYRIVTVSSENGQESQSSQAVEGQSSCCWRAEISTPKNETASWEVFRNERFRYELRLPPEWIVMARPEGDSITELCTTDLAVSRNSPIIVIAKKQLDLCGFFVHNVPSDEAEIAISVWPGRASNLTTILEPPYEFTTVGRTNAIMYRFSFQQTRPNVNATRIYFNHGNNQYLIFLKNQNPEGTSYNPMYEQILSTFRFIP